MATYRIESWHDGATRRVLSQDCATITDATRVFMREARLYREISHACVLLIKPRDSWSGTVLAHKSAKSADTVFAPSYWREL